MLSSGIVLLHDNARPHTAASTKRLLKRFRWEVFDHPPSSAETWLSVIFISFLVWNGPRKTIFWHNELPTRVENWLKTQAACFYDEGIGKLVPRYEKCLHWSVDYVEKWSPDSTSNIFGPTSLSPDWQFVQENFSPSYYFFNFIVLYMHMVCPICLVQQSMVLSDNSSIKNLIFYIQMYYLM